MIDESVLNGLEASRRAAWAKFYDEKARADELEGLVESRQRLLDRNFEIREELEDRVHALRTALRDLITATSEIGHLLRSGHPAPAEEIAEVANLRARLALVA